VGQRGKEIFQFTQEMWVPKVEFGCVLVSWAPRVGEQELVEGKVLREFAPPHKPLWWG